MKDISVSEAVFHWLQSLAQPLVDTPDDVLRRLMQSYTVDQQGSPPNQPPKTNVNGGEPGEDRPVDPLTEEFIQLVLRNLKERTGDSPIHATWQPKGKRYSLRANKVFANIHPYQRRKKRVKVEVPQNLVEKAGISFEVFDHRLRNGWYNVCDCFKIFIPHNGQDWDRTKYRQAVDILVRIWRVH